MIDRLGEFAELLRKNGVRVSTSEMIDAANALAVTGVRNPGAVRAALGATLVKRGGDLPAFAELFDLYFLRGAGLLRAGASSPLADALRGEGLAADAIERVLDALSDRAAAMSAVGRAGFRIRAPEVASLVRAAGMQVELDRIRSPLQVGFYTYRLMEALDVRGTEADLAAMLAAMRDAGDIDEREYELLAEIVRENLGRLRQMLRTYVDEEFRRQNLDFMQDLAVQSLSDKPLTQLSDDEVASLRTEVERLAKLLRARVSLKPKIRKRGRLDLRRTLRRSLATGGVPFEIKRRERERRKPRLVILCDISDSVRNVSRFMLQFVYTLQELFDRVHSFAFVAEIGELTDLFRRHDLDRALELAYSGAAVNVFANSNYGHALAQFSERHMDKVTGRTTVIIIGDGRNNYHASNASILADIRRRAKHVLWLNPESPAAWGFGDSAMREYEPHCSEVKVVYNLDSLRKVVDELVM